jgi:hypothetical protein
MSIYHLAIGTLYGLLATSSFVTVLTIMERWLRCQFVPVYGKSGADGPRTKWFPTVKAVWNPPWCSPPAPCQDQIRTTLCPNIGQYEHEAIYAVMSLIWTASICLAST